MAFGELESVPDTPGNRAMQRAAMAAEAAWEDECLRRVPELDGLATWKEAESWRDFLKVLDDEDPTFMFEILAGDCRVLDADEDYAAWGYVETEHGTVFTGFPWDADDDDEDDRDEDE